MSTDLDVDGLLTLLVRLEDGDVVNAGRDLERLWRESGDPNSLLRVAEYVYRRVDLAAVACACARTVVELLSTSDDDAVQALAVAESWARGEVADATVLTAQPRAWDVHNAVPTDQHARRAATDAIAWAVESATSEIPYANFAGHAARHAAAARASIAKPTEHDEAVRRELSSLATLVRSRLSCPTPERLLAAIVAAR